MASQSEHISSSDLEINVGELRDMLQKLALKGQELQQNLEAISKSRDSAPDQQITDFEREVEIDNFLNVLLSGDVSVLVKEAQEFVYRLNSSDYDANGLNVTSLKAIVLESIASRIGFDKNYKFNVEGIKVEAFNSRTSQNDYQPHLTIQVGNRLIIVIRMFVVSQVHLSGQGITKIPGKGNAGYKIREAFQTAVNTMRSLPQQTIEAMTVTYGKGELGSAKWQTKQDNLSDSVTVREIIQVNTERCQGTKSGLKAELNDPEIKVLCPLIYSVGPRVFGISDNVA